MWLFALNINTFVIYFTPYGVFKMDGQIVNPGLHFYTHDG